MKNAFEMSERERERERLGVSEKRRGIYYIHTAALSSRKYQAQEIAWKDSARLLNENGERWK